MTCRSASWPASTGAGMSDENHEGQREAGEGQESAMDGSQPVVQDSKRRQHPAGLLVECTDRIGTIAFLLFLAWSNQGEGADGEGFFDNVEFLVYAGGIVLTILYGVVAWFRFRYGFVGDDLVVCEGVLQRKESTIPIAKIHAVDSTQGIVQRIFGVVKLEVKTEASGSQATLKAITQEEATRIRVRIRAGKKPVEEGQSAAGLASTSTSPETSEVSEIADNPAPIDAEFRLTPRQIGLAGATSGELGFFFGLMAWMFSQVQGTAIERVTDWLVAVEIQGEVAGVGSEAATMSPIVIGFLVVVGLFFSWVGSILWAAVRYGGFSVVRRGQEIVVTRGLLEKEQVTIRADRVQALRFEESVIRQFFGYGTLYVETAGHSEEKGAAAYLHPFVHRRQMRQMVRELLPRFDVEVAYCKPPRRAIPRFVVKPTLLIAIPTVALAFWSPIALAALSLWLPTWWVAYLSWRDTGISLSEHHAVVRRRKYVRTTAILLRETAQSVKTTASFFQRQRHLSSAHITVATGAMGRTFVAAELDRDDVWQVAQWVRGAGHSGASSSPADAR
jgi:putative membrane protein